MTFGAWLRLAACVLLCLGIGYAGSLVTAPQMATWYAGLAKPAWTPPSIAFPVVWTILYVLMAAALWLLWQRTPASAERSRALWLFAIQLVLNAAWTPLFFGAHAIRAALILIVVLLIAIVWTIARAFDVNRAAAWLLVPYALWVAYATTLNAGIVALN